jgi:hypothetical protein
MLPGNIRWKGRTAANERHDIFFSQTGPDELQPDSSERDYVKKIKSKCVCGETNQQRVSQSVGRAKNGDAFGRSNGAVRWVEAARVMQTYSLIVSTRGSGTLSIF